VSGSFRRRFSSVVSPGLEFISKGVVKLQRPGIHCALGLGSTAVSPVESMVSLYSARDEGKQRRGRFEESHPEKAIVARDCLYCREPHPLNKSPLSRDDGIGVRCPMASWINPSSQMEPPIEPVISFSIIHMTEPSIDRVKASSILRTPEPRDPPKRGHDHHAFC